MMLSRKVVGQALARRCWRSSGLAEHTWAQVVFNAPGIQKGLHDARLTGRREDGYIA